MGVFLLLSEKSASHCIYIIKAAKKSLYIYTIHTARRSLKNGSIPAAVWQRCKSLYKYINAANKSLYIYTIHAARSQKNGTIPAAVWQRCKSPLLATPCKMQHCATQLRSSMFQNVFERNTRCMHYMDDMGSKWTLNMSSWPWQAA